MYKQSSGDFLQCPSQKSDLNERMLLDEGYISPTKSPPTAKGKYKKRNWDLMLKLIFSEAADIWEVASKTHFIDNRTWESFGKPFPAKELPFLSELGCKSHLWTDYVVALENSIGFDKALTKIKILDHKSFAKHAKYMLGKANILFALKFCIYRVFFQLELRQKRFCW